MRALLPLLPKPSRYAGIEHNACRKDPASVRLRVALAFPDTYDVGMSYLGQKILYAIVNRHEAWWAERVMAPETAAGDVLRAQGVPLSTLESDTPLRDMHCVGFSITHELCCTNVLYMLDLGGIPLRTADRPQDLRACPLVLAGGGALLAAEHMAPFIDLMLLGDGEESLPDALRLLEKAREAGWPRSRFLREAGRLPGAYVPSLYAQDTAPGGAPILPLRPLAPDLRPARRIVADLDTAPYPTRQVVPVGAVHNRLSLEIARGCTRGCRFCHAGMVYRPARERSPANIQALLEECLRTTGFDEISFLSLSSGDFSALKHLSLSVLDRCAQEQIALSLPSLRVGSVDDEIMGRMAEVRRTGCTLAPEAGSQRLRDVINKGVTEEDLLLHAQKLLEHGWHLVKLYFMIGLPTETDQDLEAIAALCRKVRDAAGRGGPRLRVTAALSPFVPKPFTPFQWAPQIGMGEMRRRVDVVRRLFKGQKGLTLRWHEPAMSHLEGILSRADRRLADVVERAYRKGAIFASWMEHFKLEPWLEALEECGLSPDQFTGARRPGAPLPWSHLEAGVSEEFLLRERTRALEAKVTADCRYHACRQCGACDTQAGPSRLPHAPGLAPGDARPHRNRLVFPQRDQAAHQPSRDADGRLVCRPTHCRPPGIAPALKVKAVQYRVWHTKTGGSAFLSQLELQAVLERALRRARMPLAFSQGFHPLPLLSFGRALPVGVESLAEWFSISLHSLVPPDALLARINPLLPPGMQALRALRLLGKADRTRQAEAEDFRLRLESDAATAEAARCLDRLAGLKEAPCTMPGKKGPRTLDLRPLLRSHGRGAAPDGGEAALFTLDWSGQYLSPLAFCLAALAPMGDPDTLRPRLRLCKLAQHFSGADA